MITFLLNLIFHFSVEQYQNQLFNGIVPTTFFRLTWQFIITKSLNIDSALIISQLSKTKNTKTFFQDNYSPD